MPGLCATARAAETGSFGAKALRGGAAVARSPPRQAQQDSSSRSEESGGKYPISPSRERPSFSGAGRALRLRQVHLLRLIPGPRRDLRPATSISARAGQRLPPSERKIAWSSILALENRTRRAGQPCSALRFSRHEARGDGATRGRGGTHAAARALPRTPAARPLGEQRQRVAIAGRRCAEPDVFLFSTSPCPTSMRPLRVVTPPSRIAKLASAAPAPR